MVDQPEPTTLPELAARNIAATKDSSLVDELTEWLQEEMGD